MQKTILFDFDGTIADSIPDNELVFKIFNQIADENNFKNITMREIEELRHVGLYESIKLLKIPFYKIPFIARRVRQVVKADETISKPINGMSEMLRRLKKQGYTLGIMTSNKKASVEKFLKEHNLEVFDFVYSGSNLFGKDRVLKSILKKHKLNLKNSIYVGDEIRDIQAAKKIGLASIAVTWGYNSRKGLSSFDPKFIVEKPMELEKTLNIFFTSS
jgi:phosphoglycolate phosphatase